MLHWKQKEKQLIAENTQLLNFYYLIIKIVTISAVQKVLV